LMQNRGCHYMAVQEQRSWFRKNIVKAALSVVF